MKEFKTFVEKSSDYFKVEKSEMLKILTPILETINTETKVGKQKQKELIDLVKFIVISQSKMKVLDFLEEPDFLIEWDNIKYGLEHTEVINELEKRKYQKNEWFISIIQKKFTEKYGNNKCHVNISLKHEIEEINEKKKKELLNKLSQFYSDYNDDFDFLFQLAHPGKMTRKEMEQDAEKLSDLIYLAFINKERIQQNRLINFCSFHKSNENSFHLTSGYVVGTISDLIIETIQKKEKKLKTYIENTNEQQCLLLVVQGSYGHSDYSHFDGKILNQYETSFDKVILLNFFKSKSYILK
ncbi:gas vesicle protein [Flavobacterium sp. 7E]|uniref:hypothetical protein n=1 Tax=Flavobacterium sp. 7E TaxID=2735898 RepID=UPI00157042E5|nr:hypothetical protein [Flavobacterium sp. 7E]NRS88004.1 gas vesicle protein [Flavobacterium sp. 7E]